MSRYGLVVFFASAALVNVTEVVAQTLPDCESLPEPRLYIEAGDTQMSMLSDLARKLRDTTSPLTLVYYPRSTCTLADYFFTDVPTATAMRYVPSVAEDPEYAGAYLQCNPPADKVADLGIGATFISSCSEDIQASQPDGLAIVPGPVQGYGFVVPEGVNDTVPSITREEAYFVFQGRGAWANAVPWVEAPAPIDGTPTVYIRGATTSTLLTLATNVAPELLAPSAWIGYRLTGQDDRSPVVIGGVSGAPENLKEATIGLLGLELYDRNRDILDVLAYRGKGQHFAYYPDSDPSHRNKRNVRDGHYLPWSYTEYLVRVDSHGMAVDPNVERILAIVQGEEEVRLVSRKGVNPAFDIDALQVIATSGLVPNCAMGVSRKVDGGELTIYEPDAPCGCFFEWVQDTSVLDDQLWLEKCPQCKESNDCATGTCRRGFCEVR
jgi:hypothetical protein